MDCCNNTRYPYHIPGYNGQVPGMKYEAGNTYSKATHEMLTKNLLAPGPKGRRPPVYADPCRSHEADLRARFHLLQGNIDPDPCKGTDWNARNRFCAEKPVFDCPPKLQKFNQHGYLSRLSVYQSPDLGVMACKASNTEPCGARAPSGKPFMKEYEDITGYDPFQEYDPECRHLRLPNLKYKTESCWDEDFILPIECLADYCRLGYVRKPSLCECLPLDPRRDDKDIKYYRHEPDPNRFQIPYFADPTNANRYFIPGYTGHVPTERFRIGDAFANITRKALNRFTPNYMTPHLLERCPVYIDGLQYCDKTDYFSKYCDHRKSYDGHFHEKPIRDRLKPVFDPKKCPQFGPTNEPHPICIQPN